MAQPKPEDTNKLNQILKLVEQLSPEAREKLMEELKLQELRREIEVGLEQTQRGKVLPAEEVLARLQERAAQRLEETNNK